MEAFVYHHLGLGDHIICNGLVRELYKKYDGIFLFVKKVNYESVRFMYRDLSNINLITVNGDSEIVEHNYQEKNRIFIRIGFDYLKNIKCSFDEAFYRQMNIDFSLRWDNFIIKRDPLREKSLYDSYNVKENKYVFIHDDPNRNYFICNRFIVNNKLDIIRPKIGLTQNIFDYSYLIENAAEIHCMDSSFKLLADSIRLKSMNLFHHIYVRGSGKLAVSMSRYSWEKIFSRYSMINSLIKNVYGN